MHNARRDPLPFEKCKRITMAQKNRRRKKKEEEEEEEEGILKIKSKDHLTPIPLFFTPSIHSSIHPSSITSKLQISIILSGSR